MPDIKFLSDLEFHKLAKAGMAEGVGVRKYFVVEEKEISDEERIIEFTNSTPTQDRYHDTIDQNGWQLENFRKNPVVLWAHDYGQPPVAKSVNVWVEEGKLKSRDQFTPRDLYPFGFMVYELYKNGFLNAKSVGFQPITYAFNNETEGVEFYTQELLEHSCVPVPANPEALVSAKSMGIDLLPLKSWAEKVLDTWNEEKGIWIPKKDIETVFSLLNGKIYSTPPAEPKGDKPQNTDLEEKTKISDELMDVCQELDIESLAIDCTSPQELVRLIKEEVVNLKAGRVLSEKNKTLIKTCVSQLQEAIEALNKLLDATEPQDDDDSKEFTFDDESPEEQKSTGPTLNDEEIDLDSISHEEKTPPSSLNINADDVKVVLGKLIDEKLRKLTGKLD
jgi:HK97 family phage prohead protease